MEQIPAIFSLFSQPHPSVFLMNAGRRGRRPLQSVGMRLVKDLLRFAFCVAHFALILAPRGSSMPCRFA